MKRKRKVRLTSKENNNTKEKKRKTNKKVKLGDDKYKRTYTKGKTKKEILLEKLEHIKKIHTSICEETNTEYKKSKKDTEKSKSPKKREISTRRVPVFFKASGPVSKPKNSEA